MSKPYKELRDKLQNKLKTRDGVSEKSDLEALDLELPQNVIEGGPVNRDFNHTKPDEKLKKLLTQDNIKSVGINPKEIAGSYKPDLTLLPITALVKVAVCMQDGANKYGPQNWRNKEAPIQCRTYCRAAIGHIFSYLEGEDVDPESSTGAYHIDAAICSLLVLRDAQLNGSAIDNRLNKGNYPELIREEASKRKDLK